MNKNKTTLLSLSKRSDRSIQSWGVYHTSLCDSQASCREVSRKNGNPHVVGSFFPAPKQKVHKKIDKTTLLLLQQHSITTIIILRCPTTNRLDRWPPRSIRSTARYWICPSCPLRHTLLQVLLLRPCAPNERPRGIYDA